MTNSEMIRRALCGELIGNGREQMLALTAELKRVRDVLDSLVQCEECGGWFKASELQPVSVDPQSAAVCDRCLRLSAYAKDHSAMEGSRKYHIETHYLSLEEATELNIPEDAGWVGLAKTPPDFLMSKACNDPADAILEAAKKGGA